MKNDVRYPRWMTLIAPSELWRWWLTSGNRLVGWGVGGYFVNMVMNVYTLGFILLGGYGLLGTIFGCVVGYFVTLVEGAAFVQVRQNWGDRKKAIAVVIACFVFGAFTVSLASNFGFLSAFFGAREAKVESQIAKAESLRTSAAEAEDTTDEVATRDMRREDVARAREELETANGIQAIVAREGAKQDGRDFSGREDVRRVQAMLRRPVDGCETAQSDPLACPQVPIQLDGVARGETTLGAQLLVMKRERELSEAQELLRQAEAALASKEAAIESGVAIDKIEQAAKYDGAMSLTPLYTFLAQKQHAIEDALNGEPVDRPEGSLEDLTSTWSLVPLVICAFILSAGNVMNSLLIPVGGAPAQPRVHKLTAVDIGPAGEFRLPYDPEMPPSQGESLADRQARLKEREAAIAASLETVSQTAEEAAQARQLDEYERELDKRDAIVRRARDYLAAGVTDKKTAFDRAVFDVERGVTGPVQVVSRAKPTPPRAKGGALMVRGPSDGTLMRVRSVDGGVDDDFAEMLNEMDRASYDS